jgi:hypothetical protein
MISPVKSSAAHGAYALDRALVMTRLLQAFESPTLVI